jgi:hypothetical protein
MFKFKICSKLKFCSNTKLFKIQILFNLKKISNSKFVQLEFCSKFKINFFKYQKEK